MSKKIAICFFGIARSLRVTIDSIRSNIIQPSLQCANVRIFAHLFDQRTIFNPRSNEYGSLDLNQHALLCAHQLKLEPPGIDDLRFRSIQTSLKEDPWLDNWQSVRNFLHQMHSLEKVGEMAASWSPDIFVFVRPDLRYIDSMAPFLRQGLSEDLDNVVFYPSWQLYGGVNDRFAIVKGSRAAKVYFSRGKLVETYMSIFSRFNGERLLRYALMENQINVRPMYLRAQRVRSNGLTKKEKFQREVIPCWPWRYFKRALQVARLMLVKTTKHFV